MKLLAPSSWIWSWYHHPHIRIVPCNQPAPVHSSLIIHVEMYSSMVDWRLTPAWATLLTPTGPTTREAIPSLRFNAPCRLPCDHPSDAVIEKLHHLHHGVRNDPSLTPVNQHYLHNFLVNFSWSALSPPPTPVPMAPWPNASTPYSDFGRGPPSFYYWTLWCVPNKGR